MKEVLASWTLTPVQDWLFFLLPVHKDLFCRLRYWEELWKFVRISTNSDNHQISGINIQKLIIIMISTWKSDATILTDNHMGSNRPDIMNKLIMIDVAVSWNKNVVKSEQAKILTYQKPARQIKCIKLQLKMSFLWLVHTGLFPKSFLSRKTPWR